MEPHESPTARRVIYGLSFVLVLVVAAIVGGGPRGVRAPESDIVATLNACLNAAATVCLVAGYLQIRKRRVSAHRAFMLGAFVFSTLFLVGYVVHHARVGSVPYQGQGAARLAYFALLVPHILLAAVVAPMSLFTLYRGLRRNDAAHRSIARKTLPLWLYVSASGVALYLLLYRG